MILSQGNKTFNEHLKLLSIKAYHNAIMDERISRELKWGDFVNWKS